MKWFSCFISKKTCNKDKEEDIDGSVHGYTHYKIEDKVLDKVLDHDSINENEVKNFDYNIEECSICLNLIYHDDLTEENQNQNHKTDCNHIFHNNCIKQWYNISNGISCPLCRNNKSTEENINDRIKLENLRKYICSGYCYTTINREEIENLDNTLS